MGKESKSADVFLGLAVKCQKEGKMSMSEEHFKSALKIEPHNAEARSTACCTAYCTAY